MIQSIYFIISIILSTLIVKSFFVPEGDLDIDYHLYAKAFIAVVLGFVFYLFSKIYCVVCSRYYNSLFIFIFEKIILPVMYVYLVFSIENKINESSLQMVKIENGKSIVLILVLIILWMDVLMLMRGFILKNKELSNLLEKILNNNYSFLFINYPPKSTLDTYPFLVILVIGYIVVFLKLGMYGFLVD